MKKGFRKTLALSKHVRVTVTHKEPTLSLGSRAARLSVNRDGVRFRAGVPGTDLEYKRSKSFKKGSGLKKVAGVLSLVVLLLAAGWIFLEYRGETYIVEDRLPFLCDETKLTDYEQRYFDAVWADMKDGAPDWVKFRVASLLREVISLRDARESEGNYEVPEDELVLWERITGLLDRETKRQVGVRERFEDDIDESLDYGLDILSNLSKILSKKDYDTLVALRDEYFSSDDYTYETEYKIKDLLEKYKGYLDPDIVFLNLIDEKHQKTIGVLKFGATRDVNYQNHKEIGLDAPSDAEKKKMFEIWQTTIQVLPKYLFSGFDYFKISGDGEGGTLAYVIPADDTGNKWCMSIDDKDFLPDDGIYPYTVVHEMLHYLTLNDKQVKYLIGEEQEASFPHSVYWDGLCIGLEGSYIQSFYEKFWLPIDPVRFSDTESPYFYERHKSEFITEYSSTNCAEDMAETFSAWVLMKKAPTPAIQAKFDFFSEYPDLIKIKNDILVQVAMTGIKISPTIE